MKSSNESPQKPGRIASVSKGRAKQLTKYFKARALYLQAHEWCEACPHFYPNNKPERAKELHHTRGRIGSLLYAEEYFCAVCNRCHRDIGAHPGIARIHGLLAPLGEWNKTDKTTHQRRA